MLKETLPSLSRVAVLADPTIPSQALSVRELEIAARSLNVQLQVVEARAPSESGDAFSAAARDRAGARIVLAGSLFFSHRARLVELAAQHRLVSMYTFREFVAVGGLMAYEADLRHNWRRGA